MSGARKKRYGTSGTSWASSLQKVRRRKRLLLVVQFAISRATSICLSIRRTSRRYSSLTGSISLISGSSEESRAGGGDPGKLGVKKSRLKACSPNRQGPQQCQVCGKVFNNASALTKHKLTHSDERKYVCTMCGKAFKRQDHLNGHMLTHRNKKPYECKAEGCGKSYCDARSLRRHTENHHAGSKINESISPSSPTTGPHTPNTPGSNPSTPSTPGATSTTNGHGHAALKQLLATEPAQTQQQKNATSPGASNDGLTKQQLELIQQLMQQQQQQQTTTQQQQQQQQQQQRTTSPAVIQKAPKPSIKSTASPGNISNNSASGNTTSNARSSPKPKMWSHSQSPSSALGSGSITRRTQDPVYTARWNSPR
ncbi:fez family zinc finger protein erm-like [Pogonomyrmex barbatus]|uniref:Fez family zinc finger protein erm-like n=1 Tax=Pogonomyrmex barbatus TaxID=144034 RepID=A0A6I9W048_9HYME|nr:fez family zinc finger protein erm-like [Pogonomyrmex barbatus]